MMIFLFERHTSDTVSRVSAEPKIKWYLGLLSLLTFLLFSCESNVDLSGVTETTTTTPTPSPTTTTEVNRIVTTGPSMTFNLQTAAALSMAINPITKMPAVAYYDKQANVSGTAVIGALKYAWMDTYGNWNIEIVDSNYGAGALVSACGTAATGGYCIGAPNVAPTAFQQIIKLSFKSTGAPAIVYAYGSVAATSKQVRFAERSDYGTTGTWSIGVAFTASALVAVAAAAVTHPMKAFTLNFDSADRPHITFHFYGATINTDSKLKYLFRTTAGSWQSAVDIATISTGVTTATTVGANQAGAAFCPSNGKLWILGYNMSAAAASDALLVQSSTPASDGALSFPAGSTLTLDNGCTGSTLCVAAGASGLTTGLNLGATAITEGRTDIAIDSAGTITTALYTFANPASRLITATSATTCQSMASSFSVAPAAGIMGTGLLVGSAETTPGLYGFSIATSPTERLIAYSSSTTDVHVNRLIAGAYLATGVTLEGTSAALVGVLNNLIGIAYNATDDLIYAGYGSLPGTAISVLGSDLKVGYAQAADVTASSSYPTFAIDIVDQTNSALPLASAAIPSISAEKASNGTVGFALLYLDPTAADIKLYYGIRGGPVSAPVFGLNLVVNSYEATGATVLPGSYPSLAYDAANNPVIAFHSSLATATTPMETLNVARSFNGGASFSVTMVDDGSATVTSAGIGQYNSVAVSGTTIGVSYYDAQAANTGLKFARYTPTTGWKKYVVDGMTGATGTGCNTTDDAGKYSKLVFDSSGYPIIAYQGAGILRLALGTPLTATTYSWTCSSVDSSADTRGSGIDMVLSSSDILHLVHLDSSNNAVRYVVSNSAIASAIATGSGAFTAEVADFVGSVTIDTAKPSIKLTTDGKVYISTYSALSQGLVILSRASGETLWTTDTVDADVSGAGFVSGAGQYCSLLLNDDERPMVFYRSVENWIRYYSEELN